VVINGPDSSTITMDGSPMSKVNSVTQTRRVRGNSDTASVVQQCRDRERCTVRKPIK
jgi:hypothetical protein